MASSPLPGRGGLFAEAYDLIQAGQEDVPFYVEEGRKAGSPVLELGCGTGRLLIPLARAGLEVVGLDADEAILAVCRRKLDGWGEIIRARVSLLRADMRGFHLDRRFRLILLSCNTLNVFLEAKERLSVLRLCREHLAEGGRVLIESTVPDVGFLKERDGRERVFEFTEPSTGDEFIYRVTARCDLEKRVDRAEVFLERRSEGGLVDSAFEVQLSTFLYPQELDGEAREAGLKVLHLWKDHQRGPFNSSARLVILEAGI